VLRVLLLGLALLLGVLLLVLRLLGRLRLVLLLPVVLRVLLLVLRLLGRLRLVLLLALVLRVLLLGVLTGGVRVIPAALVLLLGLLGRVRLLRLVVAVTEERVLGVPRFGAGAPAIVSHRSPWYAAGNGPADLAKRAAPEGAAVSRGTLPYRHQGTTSTLSPGALPDTRSVSRALCRMMTAAAWSITERPFFAFLPDARR
jgi:hypothetical protein